MNNHKCWICNKDNMTQLEKVFHMGDNHSIVFNPRFTEVEE